MFVWAGGAVGDEVASALDGCGVVATGELERDLFIVPLEVHTGEGVVAAEFGCFEGDDETAVGEGCVMPRVTHAIRTEQVWF